MHDLGMVYVVNREWKILEEPGNFFDLEGVVCDFVVSELFDFDLVYIGSGPAGHWVGIQNAKVR